MKYKTLFLTIFATLLIASCKPFDKGTELGQKYCDVLSGYEEFTSPAQFVTLRQAAQAAIASEYDECLQKLEGKTDKLALFQSQFVEAVVERTASFNAAYEAIVRQFLEAHTWYQESDPNQLFLYSFTGNEANIIRSRSTFAFNLHQDTLIFSDTEQLKMLVTFEGSRMTLASLDGTLSATYRAATPIDMVQGRWFDSDGGCTDFIENSYVYRLAPDAMSVIARGTMTSVEDNSTLIYVTESNYDPSMRERWVIGNPDKLINYYDGGSQSYHRSKSGVAVSIFCLLGQK